jgi:hypothetical protein
MRAFEQAAYASFQRGRHIRPSETRELALQAALELSAREAGPARAEVALELSAIAVAELAIEVLGKAPECVVAAQNGAVRHCDSVVSET